MIFIVGFLAWNIRSPALAGVRHELGCVSQRLRANASALKFRNNVLSLGDDHVAKRVYIGLRDEKGRLGSGDVKNGVRGFLERLARDAAWGSVVLGKAAAKAKAKKYVISEQRREFEVDLKERSTLAEYRKFTSTARRDLPKYLARVCPIGLRHEWSSTQDEVSSRGAPVARLPRPDGARWRPDSGSFPLWLLLRGS